MGSKYYLFQRHILGHLRLSDMLTMLLLANLSLTKRKYYQLNRLMLLYIQNEKQNKYINTPQAKRNNIYRFSSTLRLTLSRGKLATE